MPQHVREVLNRRGDLSTFVVHLTRDSGGRSARANLRRIVTSRTLIAASPMGWAASQDHPTNEGAQSQRVVSFSETPLEHIYSLVAEIPNRRVVLRPYGLAFTKMKARQKGVNPVWYVDMTPGRNWTAALALDQIRTQAIQTGDFHQQPAAQLFPFCEQMGTWPNRQKEFWWEREWRHVGDLRFRFSEVALWLCPEGEIDDFEDLINEQGQARSRIHCVDPRWGLEQIIACLAGQTDVTPFQP
jgi:hypothetical protein